MTETGLSAIPNCVPDCGSDFVCGDATGIALPAHPEALRSAGAAFLTEAFLAFGSISPGNAVTRITRLEPCHAGNSGQKLFLSVEYAFDEPGLHTELFVKFSRDFADAFRDRRRMELEAEVRLAALSRHPEFPIAVAAACFADFHRETGTGLLITRQIAFGRDGIEPLAHKCMDHLLDDAPERYRLIVSALARLSAVHKSGRLSPQADELFPFDAEASCAAMPIPFDEAQLRERVARYAAFAASCHRLLPAETCTPQFIASFEREAVRFLHHEQAIKRFLNGDPDFIGLCHWNGHIDNAWFWRDAGGQMQCGLLDWGMVRQMNLAASVWGSLSGAGTAMLDRHLDELLALYAGQLQAHGGPRLDPEDLRLHFDLSVAMLGLALMMDVPAIILDRVPDAPSAESPIDPIMAGSDVARGFLQTFAAFLRLWQSRDFGASLDRMLAREG
jgi:hypothetical protein